MLALGDPEVAKQLELNDEQKAQVAELISGREKLLAQARANQKNTTLVHTSPRNWRRCSPMRSEPNGRQWVGSFPAPNRRKRPTRRRIRKAAASAQRGRDSGRFGSGRGDLVAEISAVVRPRRQRRKRSGTSELTVIGEGDSKKMEFHFKNTPWPDVIQLFAERAGYSLVMESPPSGRFNYDDSTPQIAKRGLGCTE